jgi:hypothetical protein
LRIDPEPHAVLARRRLNHWVDCWGFGDRDEVVSRLMSGDEEQFRGAYWELMLNAVFGALGFSVVRDPLSAGSGRRTPDFLVSTPGATFFVEATSVGRSRTTASFESLRDELAAQLDRHERHDFTISLWIEHSTTTAPSGRRIGAEICRWLDSLDPVAVADSNSRGEYVTRVFGDSGWWFEITAIPLSQDSQTMPLVGLLGADDAGLITDKEDLQRALRQKRPTRYGALDHPYLIAVLERSDFPQRSRWHRVAALYGDEAVTLGPDGKSASTRLPNGLWLGQSGWRQTDVSGVLLSSGMVLGEDRLPLPEYWPHPAARMPVDTPRLSLAGSQLVETEVAERSGSTFWDGFQLEA